MLGQGKLFLCGTAVDVSVCVRCPNTVGLAKQEPNRKKYCDLGHSIV